MAKSGKRAGGKRAPGARKAPGGSLLRESKVERRTKETSVHAVLNLDAASAPDVATPIPFLSHMLEAFACHGRFGLGIRAEGDVHVDPHHLMEDCGMVLGSAIAAAIGESPGILRAGCFSFPMDGSLAHAAIDLCGRPNLIWTAELGKEPIGGTPPGLFRDFFKGLADALRATIHIEVRYKDNDHHAVEAVFKAFGRALRTAVSPAAAGTVLSTKGVIDD